MPTILACLYCVIATWVGLAVHQSLDWDAPTGKGWLVLTLSIAAGLFWPLAMLGAFVFGWVDQQLSR